MAASKKTTKNTPSKTKAVGKANAPSCSRSSHNQHSVATVSIPRNVKSDLIKEKPPAYLSHSRDVGDQGSEYRRDNHRKQYRVHKRRTRHRHQHRSPESSFDSEEGDGPSNSFMHAEAGTHAHRSAGPGSDPPQSWYSQTSLSREAARLLWWGQDTKTQKTYAAIEKFYPTHCAINGIKPSFPVTVRSLLSWITELGNNRVKSATIKAHLDCVKSVQAGMGYEDLAVFDHPCIEQTIRGIRRLRGVP